MQNFLFFLIIPLILTSFGSFRGEGGRSQGKFLPLLFTTGSPPKSKAISEEWIITCLPKNPKSQRLWFTQRLLFPRETEAHWLGERTAWKGKQRRCFGLSLSKKISQSSPLRKSTQPYYINSYPFWNKSSPRFLKFFWMFWTLRFTHTHKTPDLSLRLSCYCSPSFLSSYRRALSSYPRGQCTCFRKGPDGKYLGLSRPCGFSFSVWNQQRTRDKRPCPQKIFMGDTEHWISREFIFHGSGSIPFFPLIV